ncbi:collagen binding domain-containing protein [Lacticaseibacillus baoqingensis]|uniref:Collagen binding domain-containing protein n=1 Tax=Lacticaseibacillus baoqingensis TaxID=2486013 RepID=A0ABW4E6H0_9LACO|nr:prealbumin-like fold domain-containing protein [Lacticaseibacillus baoqingensis]
MKRRLLNAALALFLLITQFSALVGLQPVRAETSAETTVIDQSQLKLTVKDAVVNDQRQWTLHYTRAQTEQERALKLRVSTDASAQERLTPDAVPEPQWQELQATDDRPEHQWLIEKAYTTHSQGDLVFTTPKTTTTLYVTAQLNEQGPAGATAIGDQAPSVAVEEAPVITADLLTAEIAGPHQVTAVAPDPADEPKKETEEDGPAQEAASETQPDTPPAADAAPAAEAATPQSTIESLASLPAPGTANPTIGTNLVLTMAARASLQVAVANADGHHRTYFKGTNAPRYKYESQALMQNNVSTDYVENSTATAVIFDSQAAAEKATLNLDYSNVGFAQTTGDPVAIGAYVVIDNIVYRNAEWGGTTVGIDFSNNFYSGISIANVRSFDWHVTFYDQSTKQAINFIESTGNTKPQLTFTSLNPGEFVAAADGASAMVSENTGVKLTSLGTDNIVPALFDSFKAHTWKASTDPNRINAYTSRKWGNWAKADPATIDRDAEWQDRLGAPTFGDGAAGFVLLGTTFSFKRGTYSAGTETWLANASGDPAFVIPELANNKSITTNGNLGGGTSSQKTGAIYTDNELDGTNINEIASGANQMYYYINQETYTVIEDLISRPGQIVIEDTLPAGMTLQNGRASDVVVFNEKTDPNARPAALAGVSVTVTKQNGRDHIVITIPGSTVMNMPFAGGYFSVRMAVKTTHDPDVITSEKVMTNKGTVKMYDGHLQLGYEEETNPVTVKVTPNIREFDFGFKKVDGFDQPLAKVSFGLFAEKTGGQSLYPVATSDAGGQVTFEKVAPGSYWLRETATPVGYAPAAPILITITKDGDIQWPADHQQAGVVVNPLKDFQLDLIKEAPDKTRLVGAEFMLKQGDDEIARGRTDDNGHTTFDAVKLRPGTYTLHEVKAPKGFLPLAGHFEFTLTPQGELTKVTYHGDDLLADQYEFTSALKGGTALNHLAIRLVNHPEPSTMPLTGGPGNQVYLAMASLLLMVGTGLWWLRRKGGAR